MKNVLLFSVLSVALLGAGGQARAHCEVPCGIYGDELRFELMAEHITTIEKSIQAVQRFSKEKDKNYNQIVRWVANKEEHAEKLQVLVSQYFMHQRIAPADESNRKAYQKYVRQLTLAHRMLVAAMKTKQTTDLAHVAELRRLLADFRTAYFGPAPKKHKH